ncbi:MAG: SPFH domain-containing protein [Clostridiales bacterium]|nr:SPFH domain-containing protein [Clostridiales bacterium]
MKVFDVIKYEGPNNIFAWKFPGEDFNTLSQLIVAESQEAVFFKDGKALDLFGAGRYTLHTQNIPLIRRLVNLPFNGVSPFHCSVYFINKVVSMDVLWETSSPIPIQDAIYKIILPIRAQGQFGVRVVDSKKLLIQLVGTIQTFDQGTLRKYFRGILLTNIKDYIATQFVKNQVSFLEIHAHLKEISDGIKEQLAEEFLRYGIELVHFAVNEIIPPEDDPSYIQLKKALAKKAEMSVMGYDYQQERAFNVLDKAAANEGVAANIMGAGMGLGMGVNLGNTFGGVMSGAMSNVPQSVQKSPAESQAQSLIKCKSCGALVSGSGKFCPECGSKIEMPLPDGMVKCPKCGEVVPDGKFCLECGARLEMVCAKCGAKIVPGAKFCLECGTRVE